MNQAPASAPALSGRLPSIDAAPPQAARAPAADLQARIDIAEAQLVAREKRVRGQINDLGRRLEHAIKPSRLAVPVLGGGAALLSLWWLLRRERGNAAAAMSPAAAPSAVGGVSGSVPGGELPWVRLLGLAWPLVPAVWRNRVSPATATTVLTVGLPLVERLLARSPPAPLATAPGVDAARWAGDWHELAYLPARLAVGGGAPRREASVSYLLQRDGSFQVLRRSVGRDGQWLEETGFARAVPNAGGARMELSFWPALLQFLPLAWQPHWVVDVDDDYTVALVGSPDRDALWLLSRTADLPESRRQILLQIARDRGYAVERLVFADTAATAPTVGRQPKATIPAASTT